MSATTAPRVIRSLPHAVLQALAPAAMSTDVLIHDLRCDADALQAVLADLVAAAAVTPVSDRPGVWQRQPQHEWLQPQDILSMLGGAAQAQLQQLQLAWQLASTNAELLRQRAPATGTAVLLAEGQSQGRGRRGRQWASPLGMNLYLSVLRRFQGPPARLASIALVTGVALVQALQRLGVASAQLKWPNDVLVDGRKLAGVLVESAGSVDAGGFPLVIGIGINVCMPADAAAAIGQPWIDLRSVLGDAASRNRTAGVVLDALLPALALFDTAGLDPFREAYGQYDALHGRRVRVQSGTVARQDGIAMGIDRDGALLLADAQGRQWPVHAGEVSVRTA